MSCVTVPNDPMTLRWNLPAEPDLLNPILSTDAYASRIEGLLFDTLLERDPKTLQFRRKIAEHWEVSPDRLSFTFYMRRDVRWHDGTPLTAHDVAYSYERIQDPTVAAPHLRVYYKDVKEVKALDDYTVQFRFKEPYFLALEFCAGLPIVPKHLYEQAPSFNESLKNRAPVGSGPYRFLRWETGKKITLLRNEAYYGAKPDMQRIEFKIIPDSTVAFLSLKKGLLDLVGLTAIQWVKQTATETFTSQFVKHEYYTPGYRFIAWNLRDPLFADRRVRRAMTLLLDRKTLIDKLAFGLGTLTTGPFFVLGDDYNREIEPLPYDPRAAAALLKEAGWEDHDGDGWLDRAGQSFRFTFLITSSSKFAEQMATIFKENLSQLGIQMEIEKMEWAVFIERINDRRFQATTLGWSMGFETDPYQVWHSTQSEKGSNFVGFADPEVDRLIELARREFNVSKRQGYFHRIHAIIHEEQPYTFLFSDPALIARHKRFQNVTIYKGGIDILEWRLGAE